MILLQLHYNQMFAVFKLSQRVSRSCNRQCTYVNTKFYP